MSDQNREFQNQNGGFPYYGQPYYQPPTPYYQAPPVAPQGQPIPQAQVPYGQPTYYQAPQGQMPYGQPYYTNSQPNMPQGQPPMPQGQVQYGQPYYQAPQGQMPYGQPYYPQPGISPVQETVGSEPEVILQGPTFEDYGFSADDKPESEHNFGGFMDDTNTPDTSFFNAPTPSLDISSVESAAGVMDESDKSVFSSRIERQEDIEMESNVLFDAEHFGGNDIFSNSTPMVDMSSSGSPIIEQPEIPVAPMASEIPVYEAEPQPVVPPVVPVVEQAQPVVPPVAPVVEQAQPVVPPVAPVVEQAQPVVPPVAPVVEQAQPVVPPVTPVVEQAQVNPVPTENVASSANQSAAPAMNFMASMQSMFSTMTKKTDDTATTAATATATTTAATAGVADTTATSTVPVTSGAAPVASQPVIPQPVNPVSNGSPYVPEVREAENQAPQYAQPNNTNDISSTSGTATEANEEKGPEYWAYMNQLLNKFDDGQVHTNISENVRPESVNQPETPYEDSVDNLSSGLPFSPAPFIPTPSFAQEPEIEQPQGFDQPQTIQQPFAPQPEAPAPAPAPIPTPAPAPTPVRIPGRQGIVINDVSTNVPEANQATMNQMSGMNVNDTAVDFQTPVQEEEAVDNSWLTAMQDVDDKELKRQEKARKAEEKAAAKAAKAEQKAAAKAAKAEKKAAAKASGTSAPLAQMDVPEYESNDEEAEESSKFKRILASIFPVSGDPVKEIIRKMVVIIAAIAFIVSIVWLGVIYFNDRANDKASSQLADIMSTAENSNADWSTIAEKYPNIQFPSGMQTKFADLYAMNSDLIGWVRIPGLGIDYPVVQTTDDSYYLRRDYNKNNSVYGTVFLSAKNRYDELDQNTVIYGHSMQRSDDQMFTPLKAYKEVSGFQNNPIIEFNTLYTDYKFKIYAVFITNGSSAGDNGYVFAYTFQNLANLESFAGFIDNVNQRTLYKTGVDIQPDDKLITLSTCTYEFDDARLVVIGRLLRDGESEEVDTSQVVKNDNPRYPQAWYNKNGFTNPYAGYANWVPTV